MDINTKDRDHLSMAVDTEIAKVRRAFNACSNEAIKVLYAQQLSYLATLRDRLNMENVK